MKHLFIYISLVSVFAMGGCKKYLDKEPDNRTEIKTPEQIAQLLTTAYPQGNYILFTESMSDNAEDKGAGGSGYDFMDQINRQAFRFEEITVAPDDIDGPDFYWTSCYKAIAAANQALEIIDASPNKAQLNPHRGEALVARAYAHFMLVTLFAKVYDPATAASDPGVPYVTEVEKEILKQYDRGTVAGVYEKIEKDLLEGLPLIEDRIYGTAPKFHFNRRAAAAFAARFYLFKREYQNVVTYASQALGGAPADELRPWNTTYTNLQYRELEAIYSQSSERGNLLLQEANSIWGRSYSSLRYSLGVNVAGELFFTDNVTGGFYAYSLFGTTLFYNIPKFYEHFVTETINANSGNPYNTIPLLTAEEALLNRAEAYLRLNNLSAAIGDLNAFASKNIQDYKPSTHNITSGKLTSYYGQPAATSALLATLDFKRAFFMHEGLRWFDIIRLGIPVRHVMANGEVIEVGPDDKRRVLQLPSFTKQSGLQPNDR